MPKQLSTLWKNWKSTLLSGGFLALILLLLWNANAFAQLRLALTNTYFIATETSDSIVIVAIDDNSLAEYGRTPAEWSRTLFGELADVVSANGARVLAFDLIFSESTPDDDTFAQSLVDARQSEARTRIILAGAGVQVPSNNLTIEGFNRGLRYLTSLEPNPTFASVVDYVGYVNAFPDVDSRLRRQPSLIEINDNLNYSFSLATFFAHRRIPANAVSQIISAEDTHLQLTEDLTLPVDERGLWLQNYFGAPFVPETNIVFPVLSFRDVINETIDTEILKDKIVLVGLIDSLGATDQYLVPSSSSGALMSGVEIQANAIETLLSGIPLFPQSQASQAIMIVGLTLFSSILFNRPRWYWKILLWFIAIVAFFAIAFFIFTTQRQMINLFYGGLAISLPVVLTVGLEISREISRRRRTEFLLKSVVTVAEQNLDLDNVLRLMAQDVQGLIPESSGFIWVYTLDNRSLPKEYRWRLPVTDQTLSTLAHKAIKNQTVQHTGKQIAVPIFWQEELKGMIATQSSRPISQSQLNILSDLARRLAPTLDNVSLHRSLDQQNQLLEMVLRNSPASIVVVDPTLKILRSNQRFSQWLTIEDNMSQFDLMTLLQEHEVDPDTLAGIQQKFDTLTDFELQIRDNHNHILRLSAVPLTDLGHWVILLVDISNLVQLNELKTQMIRMASHDLKNPLSRVLGYGEIISTSGELDDTNMRFMKNIMSAGDEINQIITDILDLEQLRSGHMERKPASFKNLVREIVSRHEPDKDRKQQTLTLDMPSAPITVNVDYLRLGQAISNLVGNAIKYTPEEGEIQVRIWQPDEKTVQLDVQDNGYGIPEDSQAKLFTEFYRVKTKATRNISGTGLGLSLVKSVVEAHDGTIGVESVEGEGSKFYVKLPIVPSDARIEL